MGGSGKEEGGSYEGQIQTHTRAHPNTPGEPLLREAVLAWFHHLVDLCAEVRPVDSAATARAGGPEEYRYELRRVAWQQWYLEYQVQW